MKIIKTNKKLYWGSPHSKPLYQWISNIDLSKWNIFVKDPTQIRNFICQYTDYTTDINQFGFSDFWQDPKLILRTNRDDCEGLNTLACSIFYSLGLDCRLAIGNLSFETFSTDPKDRPMNHAYGLYFDSNTIDPLVVECTGDKIISELPRLSESPQYYTYQMGSGIHKQNYLIEY